MANIPFNAQDVEQFRKQNPEDAKKICENWKTTIKPILLLIKSFPFVPQQVKDAIDWIIKFGDVLCP